MPSTMGGTIAVGITFRGRAGESRRAILRAPEDGAVEETLREGSHGDPSGSSLIFPGDCFHVSADHLLSRTENREVNR